MEQSEPHGDELPILGEPLPVEFANTLYVSRVETWDFLGDQERARRWVEASPLKGSTGGLGDASVQRLRSLRDVVRALLWVHLDGRAPPASALRTLNRAAALAPGYGEVAWSPEGYARVEHRAGPPLEGLLATLAEASIAFLAGETLKLLRRCPGLDCPMLFVAQHHRRRFCHPSCSQRARQAAYYRRRASQAGRQ